MKLWQTCGQPSSSPSHLSLRHWFIPQVRQPALLWRKLGKYQDFTIPAGSHHTPSLSGMCLCMAWLLQDQFRALLLLSASTAACAAPVFPVCWSPSFQLLLPVQCNLSEKRDKSLLWIQSLARIGRNSWKNHFLSHTGEIFFSCKW